MEIIKHYLTENDCYKSGKKITLEGILVHSTGAANKNVTRYVDDKTLGRVSSNHWNKPGIAKCVNGIIGWSDKLKKVVAVQTLPDNMRPWGCASGSKGSYNNSHFQFEICEDDGKNPEYFEELWDVAINWCVALCKKYGWNEKVIVSHKEAHAAGYASNHGDADSYFKKYDKTMDEFRKAVKKKLSESGSNTGSSSNKNTGSGSGKVDTAKYKNAKYAHTYIVNSDDGVLTLRKGAGKNKDKILDIPTGDAVKCYGYYNLDGNTPWLFVSYKTYTGYVHSGYLKEK
jgi:N-acetylmuramoyl-L-alanine amidase